MTLREDSEKFNWIIPPFGRAFQYLTDEYKMAGLIHRGLIVLEGHETYLRLASEKLESIGDSGTLEKVNLMTQQAKDFSAAASEYRVDDFNRVNQHALVGMWGAVEVLIEETVTLILMNSTTGVSRANKIGVSIRSQDIENLKVGQGITIFRKLESKAQKAVHFEAGPAYCWLLEKFGIELNARKSNLDELSEISAVRNCILHNSGVVDERAATKTRGQLVDGQVIKIGWNELEKFYNSIVKFFQDFLNGIISSEYVRENRGSGL